MVSPSASVVLVEDSLPYARLIELLLGEAVPGGVEVRHHERLGAAMADLRDREADCVLLDLGLPDAEGLEGVAALRTAGVRAPVVVLSGRDDDELAVAAIRAGAQDYLVKGRERPSSGFIRTIRFAIERRRAQERSEDLIRAREDRWRTLTHLAPVGLAETDRHGRCVFLNDWASELTGRPREQLLGHAWRDALHPDDRAAFDADCRAAVDGDGQFIRETRFVTPAGAVRWLHVTAMLLRDPGNRAAGWLGTLVDVTAARQARDDLHAAERRLRVQQEDVLRLAALARDASVAQDPVPLLCEGVRELLGADEVVLLPDGPDAHHDARGAGRHEPVLRGDEPVGMLRVRWPAGAEPPSARAGIVVELLAAELGAALERRRLLDQLRDLARTDPLTGLANRRLWEERLEVELARAARSAQPLCVAALDLDEFKPYNDRHGHQAGDLLLRETAATWRELVRASDLLVRLGGDEFAVLLPECDPAEARTIVARLQAATDDEIGCSAGLACWTASETGAELLARADAALYAVKACGRGGIGIA